MINDKENKKISKFLSYVLRHHPELIGIDLDDNGWTDVNILLEKANDYGVNFNREILDYVVANNNKKRFAFNETLDQIRASQGHSVSIELGHNSQRPPKELYHGTGVKSVAAIQDQGIQKQSRQHVHLSENFETAIQVGQRHGKPYVFTVLSEDMYNDNFEFYISENGVWLTEFVPSKYLKS